MKDDRLYLHHMLERCRRIARFVGPGKDGFMSAEENSGCRNQEHRSD